MIDIDWVAFIEVFVAATIATVVVVVFYALGMRMLVRAGRVAGVHEADLSEEDAATGPVQLVSEASKKVAYVLAIACFSVCGAAVLFGLGLIIFNH